MKNENNKNNKIENGLFGLNIELGTNKKLAHGIIFNPHFGIMKTDNKFKIKYIKPYMAIEIKYLLNQ